MCPRIPWPNTFYTLEDTEFLKILWMQKALGFGGTESQRMCERVSEQLVSNSSKSVGDSGQLAPGAIILDSFSWLKLFLKLPSSAAIGTRARYPWTLHLVWKLLHNDQGALSLLANNPFPDSPPRHIRAELYRYQFTPWTEGGTDWWTRTRVGSWLPALSVRDPALLRFLAAYGWVKRANEGQDGQRN